MTVGSYKYHLVGPRCTYKGIKVPCIVEFLKGGVISGHIIVNTLNNSYALNLYNNDRENFILPVLLVDGNGSCFDMEFLQYICDENHKWTSQK